jgi:glycogen debranching enzyme
VSVGTGPLSEVTCVRGASFVVSGPSGDIAPHGDQGFYVRDTRFLDELAVLVDGVPPLQLSAGSVAGAQAVFHGYLPPGSDHEVDATVLVTRRRLVAGGLHEEVHLSNSGAEEVHLSVEVVLASDFAYIFDVKHGRQLEHVAPEERDGALVWQRPGGVEQVTVRSEELRPRDGALHGSFTIAPGDALRCCLEVSIQDVYGEVVPTAGCEALAGSPWRVFDDDEPSGDGRAWIAASEPRLARLIRRSVADLRSLELHDPEEPSDRFLAAGSPWYLTLFGRDSLWSAFMALPMDLELAGGTLRTLARRQGQRIDRDTEEEPGKILHEVRRGSLTDRGDLPPNYYGSVDATPLFVLLAHEAWCWGLPADEVEALLPHVEAALAWMRDHGDPDGDGFLEYVRHGTRGLANQGWKDSHDGIRFAEGTIARAPMALSEVQGYAYAAAMRGAELLDRFGRAGGEGWRDWAAALRERFRQRFWLEDADGPYPAVALDRDKRAVDSVASNMGHLLFTGILDPEETGHVAARLSSPDLSSGYGLRTLSRRNGGYNPISYHCGSVWPHDTAIAVWGLATTGHTAAMGRLLDGLVTASPTFHYRLPELMAGIGSDLSPTPVPYPASCRPQAWAAGGVLLMARALLGIHPRIPDGTLTIRPALPGSVHRFAVRDLPLAGGRLHVEVVGDRVEAVLDGLDGVRVETP